MARTREMAEQRQPDPSSLMAGILTLLVDARERATVQEKGTIKTEILLANAGMSIDDIAAVTGKRYAP